MPPQTEHTGKFGAAYRYDARRKEERDFRRERAMAQLGEPIMAAISDGRAYVVRIHEETDPAPAPYSGLHEDRIYAAVQIAAETEAMEGEWIWTQK